MFLNHFQKLANLIWFGLPLDILQIHELRNQALDNAIFWRRITYPFFRVLIARMMP
jgi:hypothetical protein